MSKSMWHPDNPKIIVSNGNWATAQFPGQRSFRLGQQEKPWFVLKADTGVQIGEYFTTHAEAITCAQTEARLTCTNCGRRMPYLEACIDRLPYCHPEQGQDCYVEVSRALALEHSGYSIPQKFMIGTEKP